MNNGVKIVRPFNPELDGTVLGRSTGDIGQLCGDVRWDSGTSSWVRTYAINMWAKFKPVRSPLWATDSQYDFTNDRWLNPDELPSGVTPWWMSDNCGISIPTQQSKDAIANLLSLLDPTASGYSSLHGWAYNPPRGVTGSYNEPYRAFDFFGYNHKALGPVSNLVIQGDGLDDGQVAAGGANVENNHVRFALNVGDNTESDQLGIMDFSELQGKYLAVYFKRTDTNDFFVISDANPYVQVVGGQYVTSEGFDFGLEQTLAGKQFYAYPFLSSVAIPRQESITTNFYWQPIAYLGRKTLTVVSSSQQIHLNVTSFFRGNNISVTITSTQSGYSYSGFVRLLRSSSNNKKSTPDYGSDVSYSVSYGTPAIFNVPLSDTTTDWKISIYVSGVYYQTQYPSQVIIPDL